MTRFRRFGRISLVAWALAGSAWIAADAGAGDKAGAPKGAPKPPPTVKEAIHLTPEGLHMGMATNELIDFYNKVLDQDYVEIYKRTPIGPKMKEVDAALADQKQAFARSEIIFGDLPTGIDNSPLKGEYRYKNHESMMSLTRQGTTRYFFLWNKRLWKFIDVTALKKEGDPGAPTYLGSTYQEAVSILTKRFGVAGRVLPEDPAHGRNATEVDWADSTIHVRAIDRSGENLVGLGFEEKTTADRLAAITAQQKGEDTGGIDPTIAAITKPGGALDSNASVADAYTGKAHATPPAPAPSANPPPNRKK
jgi:hypothetical protein